jgi:hypothetical protein
VPGIEEAHNRVRNIALERFDARRQKEWIVLAPQGQEKGLRVRKYFWKVG